MKKVKLLLCMLSLAALGVLTACDDDDGGGSGGGGGGTNDVVAPASVGDRTMAVTITTGTAPFAESGSYNIVFGPSDEAGSGTYTINDGTADISTGTYTYTPNADNTAALFLDDSALGPINASLTFDSETSGSMSSTDETGGSEESTFTLN